MSGSHPTQGISGEEAARNYLQLMARYERLMEISRQLNSTLEIGALLDSIIEAATELTDTEVASILLIDPHTGELRFERGVAPPETTASLKSIVVPLEGSIAGWVVTHGEPMLIEDVRDHPRFRFHRESDNTLSFSTRNMLCVPLCARDEVLGALEAINKRGEAPFTEDDVNTLTTLAAQAAVAIETVRLFQQSDFIAEMVHELRTPLAALSATAHILLRPNLPEGRRMMLVQTIQAETERLSRMTTEYLDLARLESGRTRLEREAFVLDQLVAECVQVVQPQAADHFVHIYTHINSELPSLEADRTKLKQVMLNLLTNAIKYNRERGEIHIRAELDPASATVRVSVKDTGRGIPEKDQSRVFERFYRAADSEGYGQGTGLGLVIAKRIVEAHGGDMWLESELGVGTTICFTIPLAVEDGLRPRGGIG